MRCHGRHRVEFVYAHDDGQKYVKFDGERFIGDQDSVKQNKDKVERKSCNGVENRCP